MFYKLSDALPLVTNNNAVYATDVARRDGSIGKGFLVLTINEVERAMHTHGCHFYEVLLPDRPTRVFVDIETKNGDYNTVKRGAETFIAMLKMWSDSEYLLLDSSDDTKCSFHIIGGPYLKNPFHVGALIRRITCYIKAAVHAKELVQNFDFQSLFDKDLHYIVDECIYTTNRQFRLAQMSKMGSTRVLRGCTWKQSLLQTVGEGKECLEIDDSEPVSTSLKTEDLFMELDGVYVRKIHQRQSRHVLADIPPSLEPILQYVPELKKVSFDVRSGCYTLYSYSKDCKIANKTHKSNHTWYILNPWSRYLVQKCFDEDCRCSHYDVSVPKEKWHKWSSISQQNIDVSRVVD